MVPKRKEPSDPGKRTFRQVDGREFPKGTTVEVKEETGNEFILRNAKTGFEWKINKKDFFKHYEEV